MSLIEKILRIVIILGVAVCIILAVRKNDWTQAIFWLLTFCTITYLPDKKK